MITVAWYLRGGPCIWYAVGRGTRRDGSGIFARLRAGVHIWPAIEQRECAGGEPQKALHEGISRGAATQALEARALAEPCQQLHWWAWEAVRVPTAAGPRYLLPRNNPCLLMYVARYVCVS